MVSAIFKSIGVKAKAGSSNVQLRRGLAGRVKDVTDPANTGLKAISIAHSTSLSISESGSSLMEDIMSRKQKAVEIFQSQTQFWLVVFGLD